MDPPTEPRVPPQLRDDVRERVARYMDAIEATASDAGEFVTEQMPLVAQEYLQWCWFAAIIKATAMAAVVVVAVIGCILVWVRTRNSYKRDDKELRTLSLTVTAFVGLFFGGLAVTYTLDAVKVSVAPRVVLLEKVSELVK
jgi:hypothetical protein